MAKVVIMFDTNENIINAHGEPGIVLKQCIEFIKSSYLKSEPYNMRSLVDHSGRVVGEIEVTI